MGLVQWSSKRDTKRCQAGRTQASSATGALFWSLTVGTLLEVAVAVRVVTKSRALLWHLLRLRGLCRVALSCASSWATCRTLEANSTGTMRYTEFAVALSRRA